jgi:hypothetical protein
MFNFAITMMICIIIVQIGYIFLLYIELDNTKKELDKLKSDRFRWLNETRLKEVKRDGGQKGNN